MRLFNKLKNVFFEEEDIEVEEKPIAKKVETPKREKRKIEEDFIEDKIEEEEIEKETEEKDFKFPVLLEDDIMDESEDIIEESEVIEKEMVKEEKPKRRVREEKIIEDRDLPYDNSYTRDLNSKDYSINDLNSITSNNKGFRPSPIISPIYGVLDKNYKKDEIHDKKETHSTFSFSNDKVDLDSVRRKAFGNDIATDIEQDIEEDFDADYDMEETTIDMTNTDMKPVVDKVTVGDAEEYFEDLGLEYNIDYTDKSKEVKSRRRSDKEIEVDSKYDETEETNIESYDDIEEDIEIEEKTKKTRSRRIEEKEEIEIEDNLFDLIDSMYDEGE